MSSARNAGESAIGELEDADTGGFPGATLVRGAVCGAGGWGLAALWCGVGARGVWGAGWGLTALWYGFSARSKVWGWS